jgi:hypothetical protein
VHIFDGGRIKIEQERNFHFVSDGHLGFKVTAKPVYLTAAICRLGTPIASIKHAVTIAIQSNATAPGIHGHACRRTQTTILRVNNTVSVRISRLTLYNP